MHHVWRLLRTCHSPFKLKCTALLQLAWPRALHGISIVKLGSSHYDSLRTGAVRGLRFSQVGSNPLLLLASVGSLHDPEAWAILQTFRDARTIGSIVTMQSVLTALVNFPEQVPANGPTAIIAERVARLGWSFNSDGLDLSDLGNFDIFHDSWASIHMRFCLAWPRVIATEVIHRKSFSGIQFADLPALWESLKRFGEIDLVFLRSALSGTLYTDIGKEKSNRGSHSRCQHCGAVDSSAPQLVLPCLCFVSCLLSMDFAAWEFAWLFGVPWMAHSPKSLAWLDWVVWSDPGQARCHCLFGLAPAPSCWFVCWWCLCLSKESSSSVCELGCHYGAFRLHVPGSPCGRCWTSPRNGSVIIQSRTDGYAHGSPSRLQNWWPSTHLEWQRRSGSGDEKGSPWESQGRQRLSLGSDSAVDSHWSITSGSRYSHSQGRIALFCRAYSGSCRDVGFLAQQFGSRAGRESEF